MHSKMELEDADLSGRVPYRLFIEDGVVKFKWMHVGDIRFTHPFFDESMLKCRSLPQNAPGCIPVTTAERVIRYSETVNAVAPSGIIYHTSRCGSTLLAQMLGTDPGITVLSEVPCLDAILRLRYDETVTTLPPIRELFMAVLKILGRKRSDAEKHLFIKTDSWHILFHDQLREWFPVQPFFLMYRKPVEIANSHAKMRGMHMVQGVLQPALFGFDQTHATDADYGSKVLTCYFKKMHDILLEDGNAFGLNYHHGAERIFEKIAGVCQLKITEEVKLRVRNRAQFHSKYPGEVFKGDVSAEHVPGPCAEAEKYFDLVQSLTSSLITKN